MSSLQEHLDRHDFAAARTRVSPRLSGVPRRAAPRPAALPRRSSRRVRAPRSPRPRAGHEQRGAGAPALADGQGVAVPRAAVAAAPTPAGRDGRGRLRRARRQQATTRPHHPPRAITARTRPLSCDGILARRSPRRLRGRPRPRRTRSSTAPRGLRHITAVRAPRDRRQSPPATTRRPGSPDAARHAAPQSAGGPSPTSSAAPQGSDDCPPRRQPAPVPAPVPAPGRVHGPEAARRRSRAPTTPPRSHRRPRAHRPGRSARTQAAGCSCPRRRGLPRSSSGEQRIGRRRSHSTAIPRPQASTPLDGRSPTRKQRHLHPRTSEPVAAPRSSTSGPPAGHVDVRTPGTYRVQPGDSLWGIAARHLGPRGHDCRKPHGR